MERKLNFLLGVLLFAYLLSSAAMSVGTTRWPLQSDRCGFQNSKNTNLSPKSTDRAKPQKNTGRDSHGDPLPQGAALRLGGLRFRNRYHTNALAWSPAGDVLATVCNQDVLLWDRNTGKIRRRLHGQTSKPIRRSFARLRFSPNGRKIAASWQDGTLFVWDLASNNELRIREAVDFVFSADGNTLITGGRISNINSQSVEYRYIVSQQSMRRWDLRTGKPLSPFGRGAPFAVSADGKHLAAISGNISSEATFGTSQKLDDQVVAVWEVATGKELQWWHLKKTQVFVKGVFTPRGLCVHFTEGLHDQPSVRFLKGKSKPIRQVIPQGGGGGCFFSRDGRRLARANSDEILVWDLMKGAKIRRLQSLPWGATSKLAFSRDGNQLAAGDGHAILIWDLATGKELTFGSGHKGAVTSAACTADGRFLYSAGRDGMIFRWDLNTGKPIDSWHHPDNRDFGGVRLSPNEKILAAVSGARLFLRNTSTGITDHVLMLPTKDALCSPVFSPDGKHLAAGGWNYGEVVLWETETGRIRWKAKDPKLRSVHALAFSPDGKLLVVAGIERGLRVLAIETGKPVAVLAPNGSVSLGNPMRLAFSTSGRTLVFSHSGEMHLWEMATGRKRKELHVSGGITAMALSPDGQRLATGEYDGIIRLWDVVAGRELRRYVGHAAGWIYDLSFTADGCRLVSASSDTTVIVWDIPPMKRKRKRLPMHNLKKLWHALGTNNSRLAYQSQFSLAQAENVEEFVRIQIQGQPIPNKKQTLQWINDLGQDRYRVRQNAHYGLENMGSRAEPALRRGLQRATNSEARMRIGNLLDRLKAPTPNDLRMKRVLEIFEWSATPQAKAVLKMIGQREKGTAIGREAEASLKRCSYPNSQR